MADDEPLEDEAGRTPFQRALAIHVREYTGRSGLSGRGLSKAMGKSANHLSQIINDGLIPSGPALLDMTKFLGLDQDETDALIQAALITKMRGRSRDSFWLRESARLIEARDHEIKSMRDFLLRSSLYEDYIRWRDRVSS